MIKINWQRVGKLLEISGVLISGVLIVYLLVLLSVNNPSEFKQVKQENQKLELKIDSLNKNQLELNNKIIQLENSQTVYYHQIDSNNMLIKNNISEMNKIKKLYNEKISSVDSYNTHDLDSFFTNRYSRYYH
jgi:uncharacterized membrane protein